MQFEAVLFDLDGTLLDTLTDLADAANAALTALDCPTHSYPAYRYYIGRGMDGLVKQILPADSRDEQTLEKCLELAKKEYAQRWQLNSKPYPEVPELLTELENRNIPKVIFSNKPDEFTQVMVAKLLAPWKFEIIRGITPGTPKKPDPTAALQIAAELDIAPEKFIYLGDSNTDMLTATSAGMYAVGALWGYRDEKELLDNGAKVVIKNPIDLLKIFDL